MGPRRLCRCGGGGGRAPDILPDARLLLQDSSVARGAESRRSRELERDRGRQAVVATLPAPPSPPRSRKSRLVVASAMAAAARAVAESDDELPRRDLRRGPGRRGRRRRSPGRPKNADLVVGVGKCAFGGGSSGWPPSPARTSAESLAGWPRWGHRAAPCQRRTARIRLGPAPAVVAADGTGRSGHRAAVGQAPQHLPHSVARWSGLGVSGKGGARATRSTWRASLHCEECSSFLCGPGADARIVRDAISLDGSLVSMPSSTSAGSDSSFTT